jgi:hypothetical protein
LKAEAMAIVSRNKIGPVFTPPAYSKPGEPPRVTLLLTGGYGGTNWPGGAYDPETHILYAPSHRNLANQGVTPSPPGKGDFGYQRVVPGPLTVQGLPLIKPPLWQRDRHQHGPRRDPVEDRECRYP